MSELIWEEPPAGSAVVKYGDEAAALREHPKRWARLFVGDARQQAANLAMNIRSNRYKAFRDGQFEAVSRTIEAGKYGVFARYIGDEEPGSSA